MGFSWSLYQVAIHPLPTPQAKGWLLVLLVLGHEAPKLYPWFLEQVLPPPPPPPPSSQQLSSTSTPLVGSDPLLPKQLPTSGARSHLAGSSVPASPSPLSSLVLPCLPCWEDPVPENLGMLEKSGVQLGFQKKYVKIVSLQPAYVHFHHYGSITCNWDRDYVYSSAVIFTNRTIHCK